MGGLDGPSAQRRSQLLPSELGLVTFAGQSEHLAQQVHVAVWYIAEPYSSSHVLTVGAIYVLYRYLDSWGWSGANWARLLWPGLAGILELHGTPTLN